MAGFLDANTRKRAEDRRFARGRVRQADILHRCAARDPMAAPPETWPLCAKPDGDWFYEPLSNPAAARAVAERGATVFSMELIPRISRAQSMDALSSMATIAGYKAVLMAADTLPRMFPMLMTAAGTLSPARALVIGAGGSGLQAISTARRLGSVFTPTTCARR
jgi:NAD(P) transhydrogenase subunit alpha